MGKSFLVIPILVSTLAIGSRPIQAQEHHTEYKSQDPPTISYSSPAPQQSPNPDYSSQAAPSPSPTPSYSQYPSPQPSSTSANQAPSSKDTHPAGVTHDIPTPTQPSPPSPPPQPTPQTQTTSPAAPIESVPKVIPVNAGQTKTVNSIPSFNKANTSLNIPPLLGTITHLAGDKFYNQSELSTSLSDTLLSISFFSMAAGLTLLGLPLLKEGFTLGLREGQRFNLR